MIRANYIIFSLIYTVTTNFNTLSKREAARIAKYIIHTDNVKYIALSNKEMESIYQIQSCIKIVQSRIPVLGVKVRTILIEI